MLRVFKKETRLFNETVLLSTQNKCLNLCLRQIITIFQPKLLFILAYTFCYYSYIVMKAYIEGTSWKSSMRHFQIEL